MSGDDVQFIDEGVDVFDGEEVFFVCNGSVIVEEVDVGNVLQVYL